MWLIVGLGNPGPKYDKTRHNIGFRVVDALASRERFAAWKNNNLGGEATTGSLAGQRVCLLKPMEYMNRSGFAVQRTAAFLRAEVSHLVVVHDELDLGVGATRVKLGGGHAGHNGLRSLFEQLGTKDFARVRVGIGRPPERGADVAPWVLGHFAPADAALVERSVEVAIDALCLCVTKGFQTAMNSINRDG